MKVMVTGLGLAYEFGVCEVCGIDYSWLIHNPSVLLWADKIMFPKKSFYEQISSNENKSDKAINLLLNIANDNKMIETFDVDNLFGDNKPLFDDIIEYDSNELKKYYPDTVHDGNRGVPGEIIIDGDSFCYAKIAAINASLILADQTNSNCLFSKSDYKYLDYKFGINGSIKQKAYEEIFSLIFPNELVLHNYAFCSEAKCEMCLKYKSCQNEYLKQIENKMHEIIEWRNRDEICQAKAVFQRIVDSKYDIITEKDLEDLKREFKEKQRRINKTINSVFPKIKRWTNITSAIATPLAISSAIAGNTNLSIASAIAAGTSTMANELMKYYESKNNWVGFINDTKM